MSLTRKHADFSFAIGSDRSNDRSPHFQGAFDFTSSAYTLLGVHMRPFAVPDSPRYRKRPAALHDVTPEGRAAPTRRLGGGKDRVVSDPEGGHPDAPHSALMAPDVAAPGDLSRFERPFALADAPLTTPAVATTSFAYARDFRYSRSYPIRIHHRYDRATTRGS